MVVVLVFVEFKEGFVGGLFLEGLLEVVVVGVRFIFFLVEWVLRIV